MPLSFPAPRPRPGAIHSSSPASSTNLPSDRSWPCPVAVAMIWKVRQAVSVPIVGLGGISTAADALEFIIAGAAAIQVGTASFVNPNAGVEVAEGIAEFCRRQGIERVASLIGSLETP